METKNVNYAMGDIWDHVIYPIGIYYVVFQAVAYLISYLYPGTGHYMVWQSAGHFVSILVLFFFFYRKDMALKPKEEKSIRNPKKLVLLLAGVIALLLISFGLNNLILMSGLAESSTKYQEASEAFYSGPLVFELIGSVILAPILEEMLYRGIIYGRIRRKNSFFYASLISAIVFGMMHFNLVQFLFALGLGLALAALAEKGESLLFPILAHMGVNGFAVFRTETGILTEYANTSISCLLIAAACIILGTSLLIWAIKVLK